MEKRIARRRIRLLCGLTFWGFCAAGLSGQPVPASETPEIDFGGYLAYEYLQPAGTRFPEGGRFHGLQGGFRIAGPSSSRAGFLVEVHGRDEGRFEWKQAYVRMDFSAALRLKLGLHLVPFGRFNERSRPHENPFVGIPLNLAALVPENWSDLGAAAEGRWGIFTYAVNFGNGLALDEEGVLNRQFMDNNAHKAWGGRIGAFLSQGMEIGLSYAAGHSDEAQEKSYRMEGLDAAWKTPDWEIRGEYTRGRFDLPLPEDQGKSEGFFVVLIWMPGNLQPVAGYQAVRMENIAFPSTLMPSRSAAYGEETEIRGWTFGLRWIPAPGLLLKGEYSLNTDNGLSRKDHVLRLQAAAVFAP